MDRQEPIADIRDIVFSEIKDSIVTSAISNTRSGIVFGIRVAEKKAKELGLEVVSNVCDGMYVRQNETIMLLCGTPKQTAVGEDHLMGMISKVSGIATAAKQAVDLAAGRAEIVCGSFKKLPAELRLPARHAILAAGAGVRIAPRPFVYIDKNYIRMLGSVTGALKAAGSLAGYKKAVQLRNENGNLEQETEDACLGGADILMIDTGCRKDIRTVTDRVNALGARDRVRLAFAGNVQIKDVPELCALGVDIICIGREIADAPLLDLKFDVISIRKQTAEAKFSMNLLEKSELWIEKITIDHVDLNVVAQKVAAVLGLESEHVLVVDVRSDRITLDILKKTVDAGQIAGKEKAILEAVGKIDGVSLTGESFVHSNGVLGLVALEPQEVEEVLERSLELGKSLKAAWEKRVCIFPTGFEVQAGMIKDTNSPYIAGLLEAAGYTADIKPSLADNSSSIRKALQNAVDEGYSLIITTGGVGAEDKDCTVEAVLQMDRQAAAPWLVKYQKGTGRHVKDGIRIAVGEVENVRIISLPGPNDEVKPAMEAVLTSLEQGMEKYRTAQRIAAVLREKMKGGWNH